MLLGNVGFRAIGSSAKSGLQTTIFVKSYRTQIAQSRPVFRDVEPLGTEPDDLFNKAEPEYAEFLRRRRGQRRYYGGLACSAKGSHVAIVSFQDTPPSPHWLDVYSNVKLRDALDLQTDDQVTIEIFHAADWHGAQT